MKNKAFTMVEMLVALIVALIMILVMGVISSTSLSSNRKQRVGLDTYSDIHYGFKLMENKIRSAASDITNNSSPGGGWRGSRLEMDNVYFGVYRDSSSKTRSLVYVSDATSFNCSTATPSNCETILKIDDPTNDDNLLLFKPPTPIIIGNAVTVQISGKKENFSFNLSETIKKRSK